MVYKSSEYIPMLRIVGGGRFLDYFNANKSKKSDTKSDN